jgi:nickel/cobalt exporter
VNLAVFTSIAAAGFVVAFMHAILPTHWLPFVLVGREQRWSAGKTLGVTALAGLGHVAFTVVIGAVVVAVGLVAAPALESWFKWVVAAVLVGLGVFYLTREAHQHPDKPRRYLSDRAAIAGLVLLLTLSPCEAFIGVYMTAIKHGWVGFGLLSLVLLAATGAAMMLFTGLMLAGTRFVKLDALQARESTILGWALIAMAVAVLIFET